MYELYRVPSSISWKPITGFDVLAHLQKTGRINRAFSLEDELVKEWIADPSTYPEELKNKAVFLWKDVKSHPQGDHALFLSWSDGFPDKPLVVGNQFLRIENNCPVILKTV